MSRLRGSNEGQEGEDVKERIVLPQVRNAEDGKEEQRKR